jgi:RNA polymerase I-specific transcription initiation factor RRN7
MVVDADVALVEVYPMANHLAHILGEDFSYPVGGTKLRSMSNPEVLLITLVVVSVKLLYSLDGVDRPPRNHQDPRSLKVDWDVWQNAMKDRSRKDSAHLGRGEEYLVAPNEALTMDKTKLDDFMDWFEKTWTGDGSPQSKLNYDNPMTPIYMQ